MKDSDRIICYLTPAFLANDHDGNLCNRAFDFANRLRSKKNQIIFLVNGDLEPHWREVHTTLRHRLQVAGRFYSFSATKLVWKPEFGENENNNNVASRCSPLSVFKRLKIAREKSVFWKKFRLALPNRPQSMCRRIDQEIGQPIISNQAYLRQESLGSDVGNYI